MVGMMSLQDYIDDGIIVKISKDSYGFVGYVTFKDGKGTFCSGHFRTEKEVNNALYLLILHKEKYYDYVSRRCNLIKETDNARLVKFRKSKDVVWVAKSQSFFYQSDKGGYFPDGHIYIHNWLWDKLDLKR